MSLKQYPFQYLHMSTNYSKLSGHPVLWLQRLAIRCEETIFGVYFQTILLNLAEWLSSLSLIKPQLKFCQAEGLLSKFEQIIFATYNIKIVTFDFDSNFKVFRYGLNFTWWHKIHKKWNIIVSFRRCIHATKIWLLKALRSCIIKFIRKWINIFTRDVIIKEIL